MTSKATTFQNLDTNQQEQWRCYIRLFFLIIFAVIILGLFLKDKMNIFTYLIWERK